jgi:uncharacterized protein
MKIDLRTIDPREGHLEDTHDVHFVDAFGEAAVARCSVAVEYRHTGSAWYISGLVTSEYKTSCHLCLHEVKLPIEAGFELVVRRSGDPDAGGAEAQDYVVLPMGESVVELGSLIHENFVVSIPMIVRCTDECRGLCPKCGVNLNNEACSCETSTDSRWDALRDLGDQERGK